MSCLSDAYPRTGLHHIVRLGLCPITQCIYMHESENGDGSKWDMFKSINKRDRMATVIRSGIEFINAFGKLVLMRLQIIFITFRKNRSLHSLAVPRQCR